ncbi:MAG: nitric oxide reductase transcriptional regulator NorR [Pseudomonadales bacterium]|nr:nitric oxide reductase transcriptional regulator NorR [Pseudomonadales bacterium]NRA14710.1 nitric oxide reductase transcriptional regulator NorR [Oceanospirillaceae bacterium]
MNDITSTALIELAIDLTSSLGTVERYDRLLDTVRKTIPCEAVALLALNGEQLKPLALQGLSKDTLGRRFLLCEHPRFAQICAAKTVVRFASDSELPDPYDGLLIDREGDLPVHACMGMPLYFADRLLGILTLDSLTANVFDQIPRWTLEMVAAIAAATLNTALMIDQLQLQANHNQQLMVDLTEEARCRDGGEIIGDSAAMQHLQQEIDIAAGADVTVLVCGETGVGKELVVRNLHQKSALRSGPLVYVNCAALPENLIESELFGHVKGAFTGAEQARAGKFLLADNGTLFLDEIGELPLAAQSKLLRALQSSEIQPLGQDAVQHVKVRIIAATNRNLADEVQQGNFRADLFHRLSVYPITVPSLRERGEDVALLVGYFLEQSRRKIGLKQLKIQTAALAYLSHYDWPGNVRELEHVISRSALKARARSDDRQWVVITQQDCGLLSSDKVSPAAEIMSTDPKAQQMPLTDDLPLREATDNFQRQLIVQALEISNGNWAQAARTLKVDRANLARIGKRLSIKQIKLLVD